MEPAVSQQVVMQEITRRSSEDILEDARTFYNNTKLTGRHTNYHDYEKFKSILHDNGWFGDEYKLARILHL